MYSDGSSGYNIPIPNVVCPFGEWVNIGLSYDDSVKTAYILLNGETIYSYDISSVIVDLTSFSSCEIISNFGNEAYINDLYLAFNNTGRPAAILAHYNKNIPWGDGISQNDVILRPKSGGCVVLDGPVKVTGDIEAENITNLGELVSGTHNRIVVSESTTIILSNYNDNLEIIADTSSAAFTLTLSNALPQFVSLKLTVLDGETGNELTLLYTGPGGSVTLPVSPFSTWGSQEYLSTGTALIPTRGVFILWRGSTSADISFSTLVGNTGLAAIGDYDVITNYSSEDTLSIIKLRTLSLLTNSAGLAYVEADSSGIHVNSSSVYLREIRRRI